MPVLFTNPDNNVSHSVLPCCILCQMTKDVIKVGTRAAANTIHPENRDKETSTHTQNTQQENVRRPGCMCVREKELACVLVGCVRLGFLLLSA